MNLFLRNRVYLLFISWFKWYIYSFYFLCINVRLHVYCTRCLPGARTEVTDGDEPPSGCWGLNHSPLQVQQVLLIESSPQLHDP